MRKHRGSGGGISIGFVMPRRLCVGIVVGLRSVGSGNVCGVGAGEPSCCLMVRLWRCFVSVGMRTLVASEQRKKWFLGCRL